ncbi:MAG: hypothetical protein HFJ37_01710 [Clostridia bacterium]|nr:hypothetical protein [Clostridia bacterium]
MNVSEFNYNLPEELSNNIEKLSSKEINNEIQQLMEQGKLEEALKLTQKHPNDPVIQSQKGNIYIILGEYKEVKRIGKRFKDDEIIQSQKVNAHITLGEYEEAIEIGEKFKDNEIIQEQMKEVYLKHLRKTIYETNEYSVEDLEKEIRQLQETEKIDDFKRNFN